ncbi:MAG: DNA recombination protein RmuC [Candidatus Omnitrophica bacterium]|jgi:DNA recombination protein RmuC|nr:DNA recombination protein RmuC [Candidatus Omnitrophota bacterium]
MLFLFVGIFIVGMIVVIFLIMKITTQVNFQLNALTQQVGERLKETSQAMQDANRTVGERLDSATRVFGDVQKSLGRLEETHKYILDISKDITSLQDLLRAPKFRGELGETLLGKLLEDILPKENIRLQHRFKTGDVVDAAIVIGDNFVAIDAKFPLENFRRFGEAKSEDEKKSSYRVFSRDVKTRVDEIASKYILPGEGTFDFALMYIPAEAVYYEVSRDEELSNYAKTKKVVFVSPNTFYAYLQAILYGLRGASVGRNIQKILGYFEGLKVDFKKFQDDFELMGVHLNNAYKKYNDSRVRSQGFGEKLLNSSKEEQITEA